MPTDASVPYYSSKLKKPDFSPLYQLPRSEDAFRRWGDLVGFYMSSDSDSVWACSGVVVSPSLFLTNWHCGSSAALSSGSNWTTEASENALIDLSWDGDKLSREFVVAKVEASSDVLDYALLRIVPVSTSGLPRGAVLNATKIVKQPAIVIHHASGQQKQISQKCSVISLERASWKDPGRLSEFGHDCDTESGSSGAPVFNQAGEVIGLHHQGHTLLANGNCDMINKAVAISAIISDIEKIDKNLLKGMLIVR
jgi:S1-C subfamily serine protease